MEKYFTKDEIINFNKRLLNNEEMKIRGYNKADFEACNTYLDCISDAQYADLTKRLIKYSKTQLNINKEDMTRTAEYFNRLANHKDRSKGISIMVEDEWAKISFRYNEKFIEAIKKQPIRKYDKENRKWKIPSYNAIKALEALEEVGADVRNAIEYIRIKNKEEVKNA